MVDVNLEKDSAEKMKYIISVKRSDQNFERNS